MASWTVNACAKLSAIDAIDIPIGIEHFKGFTSGIFDFIIIKDDVTYNIELDGVDMTIEYIPNQGMVVTYHTTVTTKDDLFENDFELIINGSSVLRSFEGESEYLEANVKDAKALLAAKDAIIESARFRLNTSGSKYLTGKVALQLLDMIFAICSIA